MLLSQQMKILLLPHKKTLRYLNKIVPFLIKWLLLQKKIKSQSVADLGEGPRGPAPPYFGK